jgi:hypothetical protein
MRLVAHVNEQFRTAGIEWLVLESDPNDTKGYFVFYHQSLNAPCEFDSWHQTIDDAFAEAKTQYGVATDQWTSGS